MKHIFLKKNPPKIIYLPTPPLFFPTITGKSYYFLCLIETRGQTPFRILVVPMANTAWYIIAFHSGPSSYSAAARCGQDETAATPPPPPPPTTSQVPESQGSTLCPYAEVGECQYGEDCAYFHGEICELCGLAALHPIDAQQRQKHVDVSTKYRSLDQGLSHYPSSRSLGKAVSWKPPFWTCQKFYEKFSNVFFLEW